MGAEKNQQISALLTKTNNLETKINHLEETKETTPRPANPRRNCKNANLVDTEENCDLTYSSCGHGCPSSDIFYNCVDDNTNVEFALLCPNVMPSRQCIMVITSGARRC